MDNTPRIKIQHTLPDGSILKHEGEFEMDELSNRALIGDANMKITVSQSQSDKAFGNGCETFIAMTATCNQDDETPIQVAHILKNVIGSMISGMHSEALAQWKANNDLNKDIMGVR